MNNSKKRRAWRYGRLGESLCVWHLRLRGYRIIARNFRNAVGEIDIIARRGGVMAIIEVKARTSLEDAANALSWRQRQRIARAAESFIQSHPEYSDMDMRFDLMMISPWKPPLHLDGAWISDE